MMRFHPSVNIICLLQNIQKKKKTLKHIFLKSDVVLSSNKTNYKIAFVSSLHLFIYLSKKKKKKKKKVFYCAIEQKKKKKKKTFFIIKLRI